MAISTVRRSTTEDTQLERSTWIKFCARHSYANLMEEYPGWIEEKDQNGDSNAPLIRLWNRCLGRALGCPPGNVTHSLVVSGGFVGYNGY